MDFDEMYPNRWLKAGLFKNRDVTLTISGIVMEDLTDGKKTDRRPILSFAEKRHQLILNKTNGLCLKAMFGRDAAKWVGHKVTFFPAPVKYGDTDIAVRVRGSPELERPIEIDTKLGHGRLVVTLIKTGQPAGKPSPAASSNGAAPPPPAAPVPPPQPETFSNDEEPGTLG